VAKHFSYNISRVLEIFSKFVRDTIDTVFSTSDTQSIEEKKEEEKKKTKPKD